MAEGEHILIPAPSGPFAVGHNTMKLVDDARVDPYDPAEGKRSVMISLFYPVERSACKETSLIPYMPAKTTAFMNAGMTQYGLPKIYDSIRLQVCGGTPADAVKDVGKFPLVIISPGLTFPRLQYNGVAQVLASSGYAVITMDYAFETMIVEYPDGTNTIGKPLTHWDPQNRERHEALLATRVEDAIFVLNQLGNQDVVKSLALGATSPFSTQKAVIVGHSFGGATAISALMKDSRFVGAINMDGSQYGPLADTNQPVLLFGRGDPSPRNRSNNPTWEPLWQHLKGWRKEINLKESEHLAFCDTPLLAKLSGIGTNGVIQKMAGTLDGQRAFEIVTAYIKAFVDFALQGKESALLEGPTEEYPEIVFG